jgi:hypothetical protein
MNNRVKHVRGTAFGIIALALGLGACSASENDGFGETSAEEPMGATSDALSLSASSAAVFWGKNDMRNETADWDKGYYKASSSGKVALVGLSVATGSPAPYAHAALLGTFDFALNAAPSGTLAVPYDQRRVKRTADWDSGYYKLECSDKEVVTGVSQTTDGRLHAIRCGAVDEFSITSCERRIVDNGAGYTGQYADWDRGYYKADCPVGKVAVGASVNPSTQKAHALLCCAATPPSFEPAYCHRENWYGGYYNNLETLSPWSGNLAAARRAQRDATEAFMKVIAGQPSSCQAANNVINNWVAQGNPWPTLGANWTNWNYTVANNINITTWADRSVVYGSAKHNMWRQWAAALNSCSPDKPSEFALRDALCTWNPWNGRQYSWFEMDPEPAVLAASLGSIKGSTATARYSDGTGVSAVTWPSSYSTSSTDLSGRRCSTTSLASGALVGGVIQKSGAYYRCVGG